MSSLVSTRAKGLPGDNKNLRPAVEPQLISGYKSQQSLEVYQHISLEMVEEAYQAAVYFLRI